MIITIILCFIVALVVAPISYKRGGQVGLAIAKSEALALPPPVVHECLFGPWGDRFTQTFMDGWRLTKAEYQRRNCLGCNIEQVREVRY